MGIRDSQWGARGTRSDAINVGRQCGDVEGAALKNLVRTSTPIHLAKTDIESGAENAVIFRLSTACM